MAEDRELEYIIKCTGAIESYRAADANVKHGQNGHAFFENVATGMAVSVCGCGGGMERGGKTASGNGRVFSNACDGAWDLKSSKLLHSIGSKYL